MKKIIATVLALCIFLCLFISCGNDETLPNGDSAITYTFKVTHKDGSEKSFTITSNERYVGKALINEGIISGDDGPYGLYVKTVDGEFLEYETNGYYWALYVNGEYGMSGVEKTEATEGSTYEFRATK